MLYREVVGCIAGDEIYVSAVCSRVAKFSREYRPLHCSVECLTLDIVGQSTYRELWRMSSQFRYQH